VTGATDGHVVPPVTPARTLAPKSLPAVDPIPDPALGGSSAALPVTASSADVSADGGESLPGAPDVGGRWHDEDMSLATTSAAMVGRDAELALLDTALRRAVDGESASVLVGGEAGIGKSRLTAEFRRRVADEATVLTGWCLDYGSTPAPFGPLPAILRAVIDELGDRADEAAGPGRDALQLLLPERATSPVDRSAIRPEGLLRDKALYLQNLGRGGSVDLFLEALAIIEDEPGQERLRAALLGYLAGRYLIGARLEEAVATADEAYRMAESIGFDNVMSVAANLRGCSRIHLGEVEVGLADFRLSWEHAVDHDAQLRYRVNYADSLNMLGRFREAVEVAEAGVAHSRTLGVERSTGAILSHNMVEPLLELGEIDRVEEISARDLAVRTLQVFRMYSTMSRIRALTWRGEMDEAVRVLREWRSIAEGVAAVERQVWYSLHDVEILIALGQGDPVRAAAELRAVIEDPGPRLALLGRILLEGGRVVADLRADGHDALAHSTAELVRARWDSLPVELQHPQWGTVLGAVLDGDADRLQAAVPAADGDDVPAVFRAVVRLERARALVAAGDRAAAPDAAAEAAAVAEALGHDRLRRRTAEFIDAAGLSRTSSRAAHVTESVELTAREQQVLDLIAEGLSNRQIGERLFISGKTASVHVSAILRKLGVSSRTEAAVAQRTR